MPRLTNDYVKEQLSKVNLELLDTYTHIHKPIKVMCQCGSIYYPTYNNIKYKKSLTCGHCNDPKVGQKFGNLIVIKVYPAAKGGCSIECLCECGKTCGPYIASYVISNHTTSCGNCKLKVNGKFTSTIAIQLQQVVETILGSTCLHNHHVKSVCCIDIANTELMLAIEYDGYYYHKIKYGDREPKDKQKIKKLIQLGWKVLRIKSDGRSIPTNQQLEKAIYKLLNGSKLQTITMQGWKDRDRNQK